MPGLTNKQRSDTCSELPPALSISHLRLRYPSLRAHLQGRVQPAPGADLQLIAMNNAAAQLSMQKLLGSP